MVFLVLNLPKSGSYQTTTNEERRRIFAIWALDLVQIKFQVSVKFCDQVKNPAVFRTIRNKCTAKEIFSCRFCVLIFLQLNMLFLFAIDRGISSVRHTVVPGMPQRVLFKTLADRFLL